LDQRLQAQGDRVALQRELLDRAMASSAARRFAPPASLHPDRWFFRPRCPAPAARRGLFRLEAAAGVVVVLHRRHAHAGPHAAVAGDVVELITF
jgi:hypothetical protein